MMTKLGLAICVFFLCACTHQASQSKPNFDREQAAKARLSLALSYLNKQSYEQAKKNLDKALHLAPELAQVHYTRAYYFESLTLWAEAESAYLTALKLTPEDPNVMHNYGAFLCKLARFNEGEQYLLLAVNSQEYSQPGNSLLNLAYCNLARQHFSAALTYVVQARKYQPVSAEILMLGAHLHYAFLDYAVAELWYRDFLQIHEQQPNTLLFGVLLYQASAMPEREKLSASELLQMYPQSRAAVLLKENELHLSEPWKLRNRVNPNKHFDLY